MKKLLSKIGVGKKSRLKRLKPEQKTYSSNNRLQTRRGKPQTLREFLWSWIKFKDGWVWLTIFFVIFSGGVFFIFFTPFFQISTISIDGNKNITQDELNNIIEDFKSSRKLLILPRNNMLFFGVEEAQAAVTENLQNKFALEDIDVIKNYPDGVEIRIVERIPGLLWVSDNNKYLLDINGVPTEQLKDEKEESKYPNIVDKNKTKVEPGKQIISEKLVDFVLELDKVFEQKTNLKIREYSIPQIQCQEKTYVAEKILADEIESEDNEEVKQKKKDILKEYNQGKITIEESLEKLENVKNETTKEKKKSNEVSSDEFIQWETVYEPIDCDLEKVNSDVHILVEDDFEVYLDSKLDLDIQLQNLKSVLAEKIDDKGAIDYIDVRYPDRVYYK
ncbi:hypothetical protein KKC88_05305 [Patescibacteria group bacterium]|nr:hypothetical protein [Patescibacteria group bacterium]MBU1673594.1 hypothetical protein [Patescibacteria group bacterium]MBU1964044.1 hypothetical protein [Patescibacteria group bacterium]